MTAPTWNPPKRPPGSPRDRDDEPEWARQLRTLPPNRPWMRWAWVLLGALFAVPLIAFGSFQLVTLLAHQEETVVQSFDSDGIATLDIDISSGSVTVIATDEPAITVTARVSRGLTATNHTEQLDGDSLRIRSTCNHFISKFCGVDYTIEVPADVFVLARSDNSGIEVSGTTGGVTARTDNGGVTATNVSGAIDLRSDNGSITAEVAHGTLRARTDNGSIRSSFQQAPSDVFATSSNGSILVVVPDTEGEDGVYALDLSSDLGNVNPDVRTDPASERRITAHSDLGSVTVRYP